MFSIQPVSSAEEVVHTADVDENNGVQSVSVMTTSDLRDQRIGQLDCQPHSVEEVKRHVTPSQGSYVSLLADIATVDQNNDYGMTGAVDYANSSYAGQEQIQVLAETNLSSSLQNENLVSYQHLQGQNVEYSLTNLGGNAPNLQQFVIIQQMMPQLSGENVAIGSNALIHFSNTPSNQLNVDSNRELEDAVANITEKAGVDTESVQDNGLSTEKSFLVSTNSRGEVRDIQVLHGEQATAFPIGETNLSNCERRGNSIEKIKENVSFTKRKEYTSHLKKFSLDDLNTSGKSKKEVLKEYLEKSKEHIKAEEIETDTNVDLNEDNAYFTNEPKKQIEENEKPLTSDSASVECNRTLVNTRQFHTSTVNAESVLDQFEETKVIKPDSDSVYFELMEQSIVPYNVDQNVNKENPQKELSETYSSAESVSMVEKTSSDYRTRSRRMKTKKMLKSTKASVRMNTAYSGESRNVALKRKRQMPSELEATSKISKLVQDEDEPVELNGESRVSEHLCRFYQSDDKCILHLSPITINIIQPNTELVIEFQVENGFNVSSVEKGLTSDGFTKYYLDLTFTEKDNIKCNKGKNNAPGSQKLERQYTKTKRKTQKTIKNKNSKRAKLKHLSVASDECSDKNDLNSVKEDCTNELNEVNLADNSVDDIVTCDGELHDTNERVSRSSKDNKPDSKKSSDKVRKSAKATKLVAEDDAQSQKKKPDILCEEKKSDDETQSSLKDVQDDTPQKCYTVVFSEDGVRMYMCPTCGYMSKYAQNTKKHVLEHTATKDWICEICGASFKSNNRLQKHKIVHQKDRPFTCPLCQQKFKRKKMYRCELCGKEMTIRQNMDVHVNQHTGRRPWQCEVCGLRFKGPSNLKAHMHQHEEEMRFSCTICFKKFRDRGTHRQHQKRHLGEKKHVCEHCGKSFVISSDLKKHIRTHTGEKPFKCSVCDLRFSDGSSLVRHEKMHDAKFRYECNACKRQYSRKDLCNKHIKKAHPDLGPVEVNQVSIEENRQMPINITALVRSQDGHPSKIRRGSRKSSSREASSNTRMKKMKKSWQTLTEEASKRYKEHTVQTLSGTGQYGEFSQPVGTSFSIIDYQHVPTLYGNMNQKFPDQKLQVSTFGNQDMISPQGTLVYPHYMSEPARF